MIHGTKPTTVAAVRGLLYGLVAALLAAVVALTPADLEGFGPWAPVLAVALPALARTAEGWLLDRRQPPQAGLLGGEPAPPVFDWAEEVAGDDVPPAP